MIASSWCWTLVWLEAVGGFVTVPSAPRLAVPRALKEPVEVVQRASRLDWLDKPDEEDPASSPTKEDSWAWKGVVLGVTMCWGTNFAAIKYGVERLGEEHEAAFVAARFVLATAALAPFLLGASRGAVIRGLRIGGLCAFGYAAQAVALGLGASASATAFECSLQTVVVAAFSALTVRSMASAGLAVAGVGVLCLVGNDESTVLGLGVALGQAIGFGLSYVELEKAVEEHPDEALALTAYQCLAIAGCASAAAVVQGGEISMPPPDVAFVLVWLGLVSTALTIWLNTLAFERVSATDASLILTSEPLWAAVTARLLLGETLGVSQTAGAALIFAAVALNDGLFDRVLRLDQSQ